VYMLHFGVVVQLVSDGGLKIINIVSNNSFEFISHTSGFLLIIA